MNKTISANISGIVFNIDEQAYAVLFNYLQTIRGYFSEADGRDEIMADIEARFAELFSENIHDRKNVVSMQDVNEAIAIMGQPEQYIDGDEEQQANQSQSQQAEEFATAGSGARRIYRNTDEKLIGGVCTGLGSYFNWDPIWLRLAFVLFTLIGFGIILYIIM